MENRGPNLPYWIRRVSQRDPALGKTLAEIHRACREIWFLRFAAGSSNSDATDLGSRRIDLKDLFDEIYEQDKDLLWDAIMQMKPPFLSGELNPFFLEETRNVLSSLCDECEEEEKAIFLEKLLAEASR